MSQTWDTFLNNTAYTLLGVILTIGYYQIANWWRIRHGKRHLRLMTPNMFFGVMLILIAIITTLLSVKRESEFHNYQACQTNILQHNIAAQNARLKNQQDSIQAQIQYIQKFQILVHEGQRKHANPKKIISAFDGAANSTVAALEKTLHNTKPLQLISSCNS